MCPESRLFSHIWKILATPVAKVRASECRFSSTQAAADHSLAVFEKNAFNYTKLMWSQKGSAVWYGSGFHNWKLLKLIFTTHEYWGHMRTTLSAGGSFPLKEIDDQTCQEDNAWHLERGNHKSANKQLTKVHSMVHAETARGFSLPLPTYALKKLPRCVLAVFGMIHQGLIDEMGRLVEKSRLAHDLSLKGPSGVSFNSRVVDFFLPEYLFRFALRCMINFIVGCHLHFPGERILIGKSDMKTAYIRAHLQLATAAKCIAQLDVLLFMMVCFPFGGKPCPAQWCAMSEPI
jgi:hypothetical protein